MGDPAYWERARVREREHEKAENRHAWREAERFVQPMDEHEQHHPQHEVRDVISERLAIPESVVQPQ